MTENNSLRDIATSPIALVSAAFAALAQLASIGVIDAIAQVVWADLGTLFTVVSISASVIAPNIDTLPEEALTTLAVVIGVAYVAKLGESFVDKLQEKL